MAINTIKNFEKLNQMFEHTLTVDLIAEEISTCNINDDPMEVYEKMDEMDFDFYGVEKEGNIVGFICKNELGKGKIQSFLKDFTTEDLISDSTSLTDLLYVIKSKERVFILEKNKVTKLITVADLHKQPIRMLAFSLISILEMHLVYLIDNTFVEEKWKDKLSEKRIADAEKLLNSRKDKNEALTLLDNIQLCDKGKIVQESELLLKELGFESKTKCKEFFKNIERLRNNTAHSQEEIYPEYKGLIDLIIQVKSILKN